MVGEHLRSPVIGTESRGLLLLNKSITCSQKETIAFHGLSRIGSVENHFGESSSGAASHSGRDCD